jgi:hypothetical protein
VKVLGGAALTLSAATISARSLIETLSGGTLFVSGALANSGTVFASGAASLMDIVGGAVVNGGAVVVGNEHCRRALRRLRQYRLPIERQRRVGDCRHAQQFERLYRHGLRLRRWHSPEQRAVHRPHQRHVRRDRERDLRRQRADGRERAHAGDGSGNRLCRSLLTLELHITAGVSGTVAFVDPMVVKGGGGSINTETVNALIPHSGIDLPNIAFGPQTTLAYSENATGADGTLTVSDGRHDASIALLGNYLAGSFLTTADGHGGTLIFEYALHRPASAADASASMTMSPAGPIAAARHANFWQHKRKTVCTLGAINIDERGYDPDDESFVAP